MSRLTIIHSCPVWLHCTMTWLHNQIRFLPNTIESHIVCERMENLDQFSLPNVHCVARAPRWQYYWDMGLRKLRLRRHLGFLTRIAREHDAHVLHSHFGNVAWRNLGAAEQAGMKHVVTFYGLDVNKLPTKDKRWLRRYRELFRSADLVLCEGPHMAQSVRKLGCPAEKVKGHHLGVEISRLDFRPRQWQDGEVLRILIAATFREKKGIPYALEAIGALQHEVPLEITLIGDAAPEPESHAEKSRILEVIERHKLQPRMRMLGFQPHRVLLEEAYRHHIFLSPSVTAADGDTEGGAPVSLIEMAATGMPIVSTVHCDIPEVVRRGETGLLAEERDVDGLLTHLRWLADHPGAWRPMLDAGRQHIEKEYDASQQGRKLAALYEKVVARKPCPSKQGYESRQGKH